MKKKIINHIGSAIYAHKILSVIIFLLLISGGYFAFAAINKNPSLPQYTLSRAAIGTITQTITGSGQVSASNQIDIQSQSSGMINSIPVSVGEHVDAGQLIATIDARQAAMNLENARISFAKLTAPPKETELSNAENSLTKSYSDAFSTLSNFYTGMPSVMDGLKATFYAQGGFLQDPNANLPNSIRETYREPAIKSFDTTYGEYNRLFQEWKTLTRFTATSTLENILDESYNLAKSTASTLQKTQSAVNFIVATQPGYNVSQRTTAANDVNSWSNTINNSINSLSSSINSIQTGKNSLENLIAGANPLDIESGRLSLAEQERNYQNYFVRAPFSGTIGRIPVSVYSQAGNSTVIVTIIGDQKIATISLNEVDAAKVRKGNPVHLTFDAIDGLNATGTVDAVDLVGTVNQGVVTYNVKIVLNTPDARILPGMSVNASIITNQVPNVLVAPLSAVKNQNGISYVEVFDLPQNTNTASSTAGSGKSFAKGGNSPAFTISSEKTSRRVTVRTGTADENNVQILEGLNAGEWVVTKTTVGSSAGSASAPTLLNSLGGNRPTRGSTFRPIGG